MNELFIEPFELQFMRTALVATMLVAIAAGAKPKRSAPSGGSETILLVEDEDILRGLGKRSPEG